MAPAAYLRRVIPSPYGVYGARLANANFSWSLLL